MRMVVKDLNDPTILKIESRSKGIPPNFVCYAIDWKNATDKDVREGIEFLISRL